MCQIAAENPGTHFLAFTKAFEIVNRYEDHEAIPANLVIVFSAWPGMSFLNPHGRHEFVLWQLATGYSLRRRQGSPGETRIAAAMIVFRRPEKRIL